MNIQFTETDVPTLMIKVIYENNRWYDKTNLYNDTKKYYQANPDSINIIHFLFCWEVLLTNSNFISVKIYNNIEYIKSIFNLDESKPLIESELFTEPDEQIKFILDKNKTIEHMCANKKIYFKSQVLGNFFKKNFPQYNSVYELLISNRQKISHEIIMCFINLYSDILETDEIINLILAKKYNQIKNNSNQELIPNQNNFVYNIIFGVGFIGISSLLAYKNPWTLKYFKWF